MPPGLPSDAGRISPVIYNGTRAFPAHRAYTAGVSELDIKQTKRITIVGAGMAGLTAAAYLARENYSVLLLDKNNRCGGLLNTFDYDGFFFDAGPRAFVNSGIVKPILKDLGILGDYLENEISIGVEDQWFRVDSMAALSEYNRILSDLYPENLEDIEEIISIIDNLSDYTKILYQFD